MGKPAKNEVDYLQRVGENKRGHRKKWHFSEFL